MGPAKAAHRTPRSRSSADGPTLPTPFWQGHNHRPCRDYASTTNLVSESRPYSAGRSRCLAWPAPPWCGPSPRWPPPRSPPGCPRWRAFGASPASPNDVKSPPLPRRSWPRPPIPSSRRLQSFSELVRQQVVEPIHRQILAGFATADPGSLLEGIGRFCSRRWPIASGAGLAWPPSPSRATPSAAKLLAYSSSRASVGPAARRRRALAQTDPSPRHAATALRSSASARHRPRKQISPLPIEVRGREFHGEVRCQVRGLYQIEVISESQARSACPGQLHLALCHGLALCAAAARPGCPQDPANDP